MTKFCYKCANYVRRYKMCLKRHSVDYMRYYADECPEYTDIKYRELPRDAYENVCHDCEHSVMCDLYIQGIPYCNMDVKDCDGVITVLNGKIL